MTYLKIIESLFFNNILNYYFRSHKHNINNNNTLIINNLKINNSNNLKEDININWRVNNNEIVFISNSNNNSSSNETLASSSISFEEINDSNSNNKTTTTTTTIIETINNTYINNTYSTYNNNNNNILKIYKKDLLQIINENNLSYCLLNGKHKIQDNISELIIFNNNSNNNNSVLQFKIEFIENEKLENIFNSCLQCIYISDIVLRDNNESVYIESFENVRINLKHLIIRQEKEYYVQIKYLENSCKLNCKLLENSGFVIIDFNSISLNINNNSSNNNIGSCSSFTLDNKFVNKINPIEWSSYCIDNNNSIRKSNGNGNGIGSNGASSPGNESNSSANINSSLNNNSNQNKIYNECIVYRSTSQKNNLQPVIEHYSKISHTVRCIYSTDLFDQKLDVADGNLIIFAKGCESMIIENLDFYGIELVKILESLVKKYRESNNGNENSCKLLLLSLNSVGNSNCENYLNASLIGILKYFIIHNPQLKCYSVDLDEPSFQNKSIFNTIDNLISTSSSSSSTSSTNYLLSLLQERLFIINNNQFLVKNQIMNYSNSIASLDYSNNNDSGINQDNDIFGNTILITGQRNSSIQIIKFLMSISINFKKPKSLIILSKSTMNWKLELLISKYKQNQQQSNNLIIYFKSLDISKSYSIKNTLNELYKTVSYFENHQPEYHPLLPIESIIHLANDDLNSNSNKEVNIKKSHEPKTIGAVLLNNYCKEKKWILKSFIFINKSSNLDSIFNQSIGNLSTNQVIESFHYYRRSLNLQSTLININSIYNNNNNNNNNKIISTIFNFYYYNNKINNKQ